MELSHQSVVNAWFPSNVFAGDGAGAAEMRRLKKSAPPTERGEIEQMIGAADAEIKRLTRRFINGTGDTSEIEAAIARQDRVKEGLQARLSATAVPSNVSLHPASTERYLAAVEELQQLICGTGTCEPASIVREVIESIVVTPTGISKNRHTTPPRIEVHGHLDRLLSVNTLTPNPVGVNCGSGAPITGTRARVMWRASKDGVLTEVGTIVEEAGLFGELSRF